MEVMVAVQSGTLLHALRVQLKRRVLFFIAETYVFGASAAKINILGPEKKNSPQFFKGFPKKKVTLQMIARSYYRSVHRMGVKMPPFRGLPRIDRASKG